MMDQTLTQILEQLYMQIQRVSELNQENARLRAEIEQALAKSPKKADG